MPLIDISTVQQFTAINLLSDPGHIPGPILIPNVWQARLLWGLADGRTVFNVCHLRVTPGSVPTTALANGIRSAVQGLLTSSTLISHINNQSSMFNVDLRDLTPPGNAPLVAGTASPLIGTGTGVSLPDEVAVVLTLRTAKTGQANRGRVYIPAFDSSAVAATGGVISTAAMTALSTFAAGFQSAMQTGGFNLCIAQPARAAYTGATGTQHPARGAGSIDVTQVIVRDNHFDSQRRRGLK